MFLSCSGCACKGSRSGDLVTLAVDGVEVQAFFQWQLTLNILCDGLLSEPHRLGEGTVSERNMTSMKQ